MKAFMRNIRNFFGTTRSQTNAFVLLLIILVISIFSQPLTRWYKSSQPQDFTADKNELDSLLLAWETVKKSASSAESGSTEKQVITYFEFNPNTINKDEFIALGFHDKLASRIINYRSKGGMFRTKADVLKIYGMDSVLYSRLMPYILLPDKIDYTKADKKSFTKREWPVKEKALAFNLNEADTTQLQKTYGIGSVLAKQIIKYRDRLGGFVTHTQLTEVYRLDTVVIQKIMAASYLPDPVVVQKINLNTADEKTLAAHPYFSKKIAAAIVTYRFQHGNFQSVDDLTKINLIDKRTLAKIFPYVTIDP